eukprot:CAMPEP_0181537458 /NCGR_PEP_ID=MMETSP1110-20121109/75359_1 /TAXON_ID=174948 /ORGANISM="Symbiodinium sp., Strain CCMP421" /LENGTH=45 /DNA_ID= /DNA_START= /DNA_END= /DNA_ORIENTATION=
MERRAEKGRGKLKGISTGVLAAVIVGQQPPGSLLQSSRLVAGPPP